MTDIHTPTKEVDAVGEVILAALAKDGKVNLELSKPGEGVINVERFEHGYVATSELPNIDEVFKYAERLERMDRFDRYMQKAYLDGMIEGVKTARIVVEKLLNKSAVNEVRKIEEFLKASRAKHDSDVDGEGEVSPPGTSDGTPGADSPKPQLRAVHREDPTLDPGSNPGLGTSH